MNSVEVESDELVSIVVPVFNVQSYLEECVDSILAQTYTRLEVILINDGSTDRSGAICDAYAASDGRVRVIHQVNAGLSAARNAGVAVSRGRWLLFVDSDDWVHSDTVDVLLKAASRSDADIAVGVFQRFGEASDLRARTPPHAESVVLTAAEGMTALMGPMHTLLTVAWGKLFRRSLFANLEFPVGRLHEDEFVAHRLLYDSRRVIVVGRPLYFYRQHNDSIMGAGFNSDKAMDAIAAYADRLRFLQRVGRADLLPLARAQLFRRYMKVFRGTPKSPQSVDLRSEMRLLAQDMRRNRDLSTFVAFASAYASWPELIDPFYSAYVLAIGSGRGKRRHGPIVAATRLTPRRQ